jgi:thiamine-phosphate pyrophosphorylase
MLLYYVTDRKSFAGTEVQQREALLSRIRDAAHAGVQHIQLREKDLSPRALERLAREALHAVRTASASTKLLINGRTDVALAVGADGVHLPDGEVAVSEVRALWMHSSDREPLIGVSAHTIADVFYATAYAADFAVIAPIFAKGQTNTPGIGLDTLHAACSTPRSHDNQEAKPARFAVLAMGGVTLSNARACIKAGADGVAGIRLFQQGDVFETVRRLLEL